MNKYVFLCCSVFIFSFCFFNTLYADTINTISFNNPDISLVYEDSGKIIDRLTSPDGQLVAINDDCHFIIITNKQNEIIFKFKWDDESKTFPGSDTVYLLDWSAEGDVLWFFTWIPAEVAYIAKADIHAKKLFMYSVRTSENVSEYFMDTKDEIFYYSSYNSYVSEDDPVSLYGYDIKSKKETLVMCRKRGLGRFNPMMEEGMLVYDK